MTTRPRTRPDLEARVLPMHTPEMAPLMAARLGVPVMRVVDGRPSIIRPSEES
jgi:hypothetical protein